MAPKPVRVKLADPAQNQYLAELEGQGKKANYFFRAMGNRPEALKAFVPLYGAIMGPGLVDRRVKELAYLTASFTNVCAYCSAAHVASGKKAGVGEEEIEALRTARDETFSESERAVIRYVRELTRRADAPNTREILFQHFSDEQVVEITLVAAMANFTNRFNNGLGMKPEA